jgi:hypothetical protein
MWHKDSILPSASHNVFWEFANYWAISHKWCFYSIPADALGTLSFKSRNFRKRVRKVTNKAKWRCRENHAKMKWSEIHNIGTRQSINLFPPSTSLTKVQKGAYYSGIKIYNYLLMKLEQLSNDQKSFRSALKRFIYINSFYSMEQYLNYKIIKWFLSQAGKLQPLAPPSQVMSKGSWCTQLTRDQQSVT